MALDPALDPIFDSAGQTYNLNPDLLKAVAMQESGGSTARSVVSSGGAQGIMQLLPSTAKQLGVTDPFDPVQAIPAAANLLSRGLAKGEALARDNPNISPVNYALMTYFGGDESGGQWGPRTHAYPGDVAAQYAKLTRGASAGDAASGNLVAPLTMEDGEAGAPGGGGTAAGSPAGAAGAESGGPGTSAAPSPSSAPASPAAPPSSVLGPYTGAAGPVRGLAQPPPGAYPKYDMDDLVDKWRRAALSGQPGGGAPYEAIFRSIYENGMPYSDGKLYPMPGQQQVIQGRAAAEAGGTRLGADQVHDYVVNGQRMTLPRSVGDYLTARQLGQDLGPTGGPAATGGAAATAPPGGGSVITYAPLSGEGTAAPGVKIGGEPVMTPEQQRTSEAYGGQAAENLAAVKQAQDLQGRVMIMRRAAAQFSEAPFGGVGASAQWRLDAAKRFVDLATQAGLQVPDSVRQGVASGEVIGKEGSQIQADLVKMLGSREAVQVFQQTMNRVPNLTMTTGGYNALVNSLYWGAQRQIDLANYQDAWLGDPAHHNSIAGMQTAFNKDHPIDSYSSHVAPFSLKGAAGNYQPNTVYLSPGGSRVMYDPGNKTFYDAPAE